MASENNKPSEAKGVTDDDGNAYYINSEGRKYSLKELVSMRAILLHRNSGLFLDGETKVGNRTLTENSIRLEIDSLNALSAALKSVTDNGFDSYSSTKTSKLNGCSDFR